MRLPETKSFGASSVGMPRLAFRGVLIANVVAIAASIVLLVPVFGSINALIGDVARASELFLRLGLVASVVAVAAPIAAWNPRRGGTWYCAIAVLSGVALFVLTRVFGGPVPTGSEEVYAIPVVLGVGLITGGSVAATVGVRRSASPAARARRPHHLR